MALKIKAFIEGTSNRFFLRFSRAFHWKKTKPAAKTKPKTKVKKCMPEEETIISGR